MARPSGECAPRDLILLVLYLNSGLPVCEPIQFLKNDLRSNMTRTKRMDLRHT